MAEADFGAHAAAARVGAAQAGAAGQHQRLEQGGFAAAVGADQGDRARAAHAAVGLCLCHRLPSRIRLHVVGL